MPRELRLRACRSSESVFIRALIRGSASTVIPHPRSLTLWCVRERSKRARPEPGDHDTQIVEQARPRPGDRGAGYVAG
jgi:hypothetical protein